MPVLGGAGRAGRLAVGADRDRPYAAPTRATGWPPWPPRSARSAATSPSCRTGCEIRPRPLRASARPFASHDDHRLVMAAAVLGLAVPGLRVQQRGDRRQDVPRLHLPLAADAGAARPEPRGQPCQLDEDDVRVRPGRGRGRGRGAGPRTRSAVEAFVAAVDRGRYRCWIGDREVTAMKARELGRAHPWSSATRSAWPGTSPARPDTLARVVRVEPRTYGAAPLGR